MQEELREFCRGDNMHTGNSRNSRTLPGDKGVTVEESGCGYKVASSMRARWASIPLHARKLGDRARAVLERREQRRQVEKNTPLASGKTGEGKDPALRKQPKEREQ